MASAELSRYLGQVLGTHVVEPDERQLVFVASQQADTWEDLPVEVRRLVKEIEARPVGLGGR